MHEHVSIGFGSHCGACNAPLRVGARFCSSCGSAIGSRIALPLAATVADSSAAGATVTRNWLELKRVGWLFGLLLSSSLALGLVARLDTSRWPEAIVTAIDALVVLGFVVSRFREIAPLLAIPHIALRPVLRVALVSLGFAMALAVYFRLIKYLGVPVRDPAETFALAGWPMWSIFALISVMPAVVEELAFRGVIQSSLEHVGSDLEAWLIQAALFSVLHLSPIMFPSHFVMGLWFGLAAPADAQCLSRHADARLVECDGVDRRRVAEPMWSASKLECPKFPFSLGCRKSPRRFAISL